MSGGAVTRTSIPSLTMENLQKFVDQFGTGDTVQTMVERIYRALPATGETFKSPGGVTSSKGAAIVNDRYLQADDGTMYQFIRQRSKGTWKVKVM